MSGAGKSTIAINTYNQLKKFDNKIKILDGDEIRDKMPVKLGFSPSDIEQNNMRIAKLCQELQPLNDIIIVPIISPFILVRQKVKNIIGKNFFEIYIKTSLSRVIKKDVKGLYKKALNNEIENFIGIDPSVPFEPPIKPDLIINTESTSLNQSVEKLINFINDK